MALAAALTVAGVVGTVAPASADTRSIAGAQCHESEGCWTAVADSRGQTYVTDSALRRVYVYSPDGALLRTMTGSAGARPFGTPGHVAIDAADNAYVGNEYGVQIYDADGTYLRSDAGGAPGVSGVAVDAAGNFFTISGPRVTKFDPAGTWVRGWPSNSSSESYTGIAYNPADGKLYVADSYFRRVVKLNTDLEQVGVWGQFGADPGDFRYDLGGVSIDSAGAVYVASSGRGIQKFSADGAFLGSWESTDAYRFGIRGSHLYVGRGRDVAVVDLDRPTAAIKANDGLPAWQGLSVPLSATGSSMPFGTITGYEWDLDGDGMFEHSTGTSPTTETTFATAGPHEVRVKVSAGTATSIARVTVDVQGVSDGPGLPPVPWTPPGDGGGSPPGPLPGGPTPPGGTVGVSINNGAQYTNDPRVTIRLVWPAGARSVLASNDGGFRQARSFRVATTIPWTLASSGPERLPKTVYLRFDVSGNQTFSDDIILDQTAPKISSAVVEPAASSRATGGKRSYRVRLKASDRTSGVARVQFATTSKKRGGARVKYRQTLTVRGAKPRFVRVQDKAGNYSGWRRLR